MSQPAPRRPVFYAYAVAVLATVAALVVRWFLDPWLHDALPLVTLYGAVAAAAWFGGWRPAVLAMVLGGVAANFFFIEPRGTLGFGTPALVIGAVAYLATCTLVIGFAELMRRAQQSARAQQDLVAITLASIGDAVISTDVSGRVTSLNHVAESLSGWTQAEAKGKPLPEVFRIVNEVTRRAVANPVERALAEGAVVGLANHTLLIRRDGSEIQIDDSAAPIRGADGQVLGCVLVFRDISVRRGAEQEAAERLDAAQLFASIVTSSDDAIVSKSLQGVVQTWNAGAERLFGYSADEAVGQHISFIIPKDRLGEEDEILSQLRAGNRIDHFNTLRRHKSGHLVHVSLSVSPVRDQSGRVIGASKIARDITAQKEAEQRVARLMGELRDADRRKDEFLATLAHELRGPLAPVRNSLEVMKRGADPAVVDRARTMLDRQVAHMERLVDDLLDIARITQNRLELRTQRLDVALVLRQAIEAVQPLADAAGHVIVLDSGGAEPVEVVGDAVRLGQVFGNLLNNSIKYTERGGRIEVTCRSRDGNAEVSVRDNGIGIPAELLPRVFELFAQVDDSPERTRGGLGLGLTIVKRLIGLHRGLIEAKSDGKNQGSEFVVTLPLAPAGTAAPERPATSREVPAAPPRRVLVVDDLVDSAESLAMLLRLDGHQVFVAHDGPSAIETAQRVRPDLILLDIGLPQLSGYDVCRRIRKEPWGRDIYVVALTGWGQEEDRRQSEEAGFDAHLVKPIHPEQLRDLLRRSPEGTP